MASEPTNNLPLFYKDLMPLNNRDHGKWRSRQVDKAAWLVSEHAVPITVDEFGQAQRSYPIVFSMGDVPVPLALMGLNEGVNTFVDDEGKFIQEAYVPAYVRRYPYLLARLQQGSDTMSLCFDPSSGLLGEHKEGEVLFTEAGEITPFTKSVLDFCERFEQAGERTRAFFEELNKHDLLMDGEVAIQRNDAPDAPPFVYRGFRIINVEKFQEIRGDVMRGWVQNGMMSLIYAHLMSLELLRDIFARQTAMGKGPGAEALRAEAAQVEDKPAKKTAKKEKA